MVRIPKGYWLPAVVFLGGSSLLAGGRFPYMFFYLAVLLFLIPYGVLQRNLARLTGDIEVSSPYGEVGEKLSVQYKVTNSPTATFFYLELTGIIGSSLKERTAGKIISLEGGETAYFQREVLCARRGIYDLAAFKVKTGDPFGLFIMERPLGSGKKIKIYPRLKDYPAAFLPAKQHFGDLLVKDNQFEDYSQVSNLRAWQDGDSIKRIHWKQSARHDEVVVKNFALRGDASLIIFVDMAAKSYRHDHGHRLEDLAVEVAASIVHFGLQKNLFLRVFSEPGLTAGLPGRHFRDYRGIMDRVIDLAPTGNGGFFAYVHRQSYYLTPKSSLYLITPALTLEDAAVLLGLQQRGFNQVLFYLALQSPTSREEPLLDKLKEAGINVHVLPAGEGGGE